ncbi:MAG: 50S ribosomal protein L25 [Candidatus Omnitrophica bacterium]|jgi:large subunit ribosomal protein L25|nr:50S ribosomal protein L25 [Candidatus Omnitrophota bacterium]MDD5078048.1 50S ribosomal protein L25 [Candidatus Omnitrophota bacterium]
MEEIILEAEIREGRGRAKAKDLRETGFLPAVVYFHGQEASSVTVSRGALLKLVHQHHLENVIINLKIKSGDKTTVKPCLVKEIQYDPVSEDIIHVDFSEISLTESIKVNVPVQVKGEAVGVKQDGGSLEYLMWEIEVECLPTNIPQEITVDIAALKIGDAVHIKDIAFPDKVVPVNEPETVVLHVVAPMKEEAPAEGEEGEAAAEPEVIKEKKEVPGEGAPSPEAKDKAK